MKPPATTTSQVPRNPVPKALAAGVLLLNLLVAGAIWYSLQSSKTHYEEQAAARARSISDVVTEDYLSVWRAEVYKASSLGALFWTVTFLSAWLLSREWNRTRKAEQEVLKGEQRFRAFVENANDLVCALSPGGIITYVAPNVEFLLGYLPSALIGTPLERYIHEEDLPASKAFFQQVMASGTHQSGLEYRVRRSHGNWLWFLSSASLVVDPATGAPAFLGIGRDITERKQAEEALQRLNEELEERVRERSRSAENAREILQTIIDCVSDWVWDVGAAGHYICCSPQVETCLGYRPAEMIGKAPAEFMSDEEGAGLVRMKFEELFRQGLPIRNLESWFIARDGRKVLFSTNAVPIFDESGNLTGYRGVDTDLTERRQAEDALRRQSQSLEVLLETIPSPIFYKGVDGRYTGCNRAFEDLVGRPRREIIGRTAYDLVPKEMADEYTQKDRELFAHPGVQHYDCRVQRRNGEMREMLFDRATIVDGEGRLEGLIGVISDITERKRAEEALRDSEANFRTFFESMADMILVATPEGEVVFSNTAVTRTLGYSAAELAAMSMLDLYPEDMREEAKSVLAAMLHGRRESCPLPLAGRNGPLVPVETRVWFGRWNGVGCLFSISKNLTAEQEAQQRFERLFHNNPAPMAVSSLSERCFVEVNDAFLKTLGYTRAEVIGKSSKELEIFLHSAQQAEVVGKIEMTGRISDSEVQVRRKDGVILDGLLSAEVISSQGREYVLAVMMDITDRKRAEAALRDSEERFHSVFDHSLDGILLAKADGSILAANHAACDLLGRSEKELFEGGRELLADETSPAWIQFLEGHPPSSWFRGEIKFQRKGGSTLPVGITARHFSLANGESRSSIIFRDITKQLYAEQAIKKSEERLNLALEATRDAVWDWDLTTDTCYYSHRWWSMLGFAENELKAGPDLWRQLTHLEDLEHARRVFKEAFAAKQAYEVETRLLHKEGHYVPVLTRGFILRDDKGKPTRISGTSTDLTERKKIEAQRQQLVKAESVNRMASAIAHHFNNMLGAVIGNLELALDDVVEGSPTSTCIAEAMTASRKAAEISRSMLIYLGQAPIAPKAIDLTGTAEEALLLVHTSLPKKVHLEMELPSEEVRILGDASFVQQILTNLVQNASEAIEERDGFVTVGIRPLDASDIHERKVLPLDWQPQAKRYACVSVADTGGGMDAATQEKIFDPFFSTKFTGRGLGLAVVLGLVRAHGGAIAMESRVGWGSTFRIYLPMSEREAQPSRQESKVISSVAEAKALILLVEDEPMVRNMAQTMLMRLGYEVVAAGDGAEALDIFGGQKDEFSVVILDLNMPRMGGWETLAALRALRPDIPAILASGYEEVQAMQGDHVELPQAFLHKPYRKKDLEMALGVARPVLNTLKEKAS